MIMSDEDKREQKNATQKLPPRDYGKGQPTAASGFSLNFSSPANPGLVPRHDAHKLPIKTCSVRIYYTRSSSGRYFTL